jgi:hypothetical protein
MNKVLSSIRIFINLLMALGLHNLMTLMKIYYSPDYIGQVYLAPGTEVPVARTPVEGAPEKKTAETAAPGRDAAGNGSHETAAPGRGADETGIPGTESSGMVSLGMRADGMEPRGMGACVLMDQLVASTQTLVDILSLRLGLHFKHQPYYEVFIAYYKAMSKALAKMPGSVLAASFILSPLSVVKSALAWRNELRLAGCHLENKSKSFKSSRLATLSAIEDEYASEDSEPDLLDQVEAILAELDVRKPDCSMYEIYLPCAPDLFRPLDRELLEKVKQYGAKLLRLPEVEDTGDNLSVVRRMLKEPAKSAQPAASAEPSAPAEAAKPTEPSAPAEAAAKQSALAGPSASTESSGPADSVENSVTLKPDDDSFLVYEFDDEHSANEYLSFNKMDDIDVWINPDNKQMDNWLYRMGRPLTGSSSSAGRPQILELFRMGISLFRSPLDIRILVAWLQAGNHPLPPSFRNDLARTVMRTGGYRNDDCGKVVKDYIEGAYVYLDDEQKKLSEEEQDSLRKKGEKERRELVGIFLPPDEDAPEEDEVDVERLRKFATRLGGWAKSQMTLSLKKADGQILAEQYSQLCSMAEALNKLLDTLGGAKKVKSGTLDAWIRIICKMDEGGAVTFAEQGCRDVISGPEKILSCAGKTLWMNMGVADRLSDPLDFLYPSELRELEDLKLLPYRWEEEKRDAWRWNSLLTPFLRTGGRLVLVRCLHREGTSAQKPPLIVRLERQISNFGDIVRHPQIEDKVEVTPLEKPVPEGKMTVDPVDKSLFPEYCSVTSLDKLIFHPFEYLMESVLTIKPEAALSKVNIVKGNVAHGVIEVLFAPRGGKRTASALEIEARINNEYGDVFNRLVEGEGAVLKLKEKRFECGVFRERLRSCLDSLVAILEDNGLAVVECEHSLPPSDGMGGRLDMVLEDGGHNPVVVDFKWSSSKDKYSDLLKKNRAVQLEAYRYLLQKEKKMEVKRVAYYIMPEARLYSKEDFKGDRCTKVKPVSYASIIQQLLNSIKYRLEQLQSGTVEVQGTFEDLQYVKDTGTKDLLPLEKDDKEQVKDAYSNYKLFQK